MDWVTQSRLEVEDDVYTSCLEDMALQASISTA
jgi:hypothetical protein